MIEDRKKQKLQYWQYSRKTDFKHILSDNKGKAKITIKMPKSEVAHQEEIWAHLHFSYSVVVRIFLSVGISTCGTA